jgi:hypothetical protein
VTDKPTSSGSNDSNRRRNRYSDRRRQPRSQRPDIVTRFSNIDVMALALTEKINIDPVIQQVNNQIRSAIRDSLREVVRESIATPGPHRTWLAEIDRIAQSADDIEELRKSISAYLRQAGIKRVDNFHDDEKRFVLLGREGEAITIQPAYIDTVNNQTILAGRARREQKPISPSIEPTDLNEDIQ